MNTKIKFVIDRAKSVLLNPIEAWVEIKPEQTNIRTLFKDYIFYLALIPALASLIGYGITGINMGVFGRTASLEWGLSMGLQSFLSAFIGIYIVSLVISKLAPKYNCDVSLDEAAKLVGYAYTPALVSGIFYLFPSLAFIVFLGGLYSLYILYQGFQIMTGVSDSSKSTYLLVSIVASIGVTILISVILGALFATVGLSAYNGANFSF